MLFPVDEVEKYGQLVKRNTGMDALRRVECLCMNCAKLGHCSIASRGLELCKDTNIAFAVTRCPEFEQRQKD